MDNYTKGAVAEYLERNRETLEGFVTNGIIDQSEVESRLDEIRQSIEKDLLTNNAYATLLMELNAKKRRIDDSTFYISLTDIAKMKDPKNPSYIIQGWLRDRNTFKLLGLWEREHNPKFFEMGYHQIERALSDPSFTLTAKIWKEKTDASVKSLINRPLFATMILFIAENNDLNDVQNEYKLIERFLGEWLDRESKDKKIAFSNENGYNYMRKVALDVYLGKQPKYVKELHPFRGLLLMPNRSSTIQQFYHREFLVYFIVNAMIDVALNHPDEIIWWFSQTFYDDITNMLKPVLAEMEHKDVEKIFENLFDIYKRTYEEKQNIEERFEELNLPKDKSFLRLRDEIIYFILKLKNVNHTTFVEYVNNHDPDTMLYLGIAYGKAICRGLTNCIPETGEVKKMVASMLAYATSKDKMLIEYQQVTKEIEELLEKAKETETMCIMTQGNKEPYMEQIKAYYATIARLRERAVELKKKIASNEKFQEEIKRISGWLEEDEVSFAEYDDDIVRYLVESIYITQDLKLIINMKSGETVEEEIYTIE